jgi:hypothetical protein
MSDVRRCCRDGWAHDLNSRNMVCLLLSLVLILLRLVAYVVAAVCRKDAAKAVDPSGCPRKRVPVVSSGSGLLGSCGCI